MPDTKPTPTVIDSDKNLAAKWFRCHRPGPCRQAGITTPAHEKLHEDGEAQMAGEIAAAREAWGAPRGEVAALVEAAERVANCAKHPAVANLWVIVDAQMHPNIQGGVSREAVAGLVEAGKAFFAEDSWCAFAEMHDATATKCPCGYVRLRAALERAKEAQG